LHLMTQWSKVSPYVSGCHPYLNPPFPILLDTFTSTIKL
jgi:hypothetical protein